MDTIRVAHLSKAYTSTTTEIVVDNAPRQTRTRQVLRDLTVEFPIGKLPQA